MIPAMGEQSILSILILLALFIVVPYIMKVLGQHSAAGRDAGRPVGEQRDTLHPENMNEYIDELSGRHDHETHDYNTQSGKPIHPKWF